LIRILERERTRAAKNVTALAQSLKTLLRGKELLKETRRGSSCETPRQNSCGGNGASHSSNEKTRSEEDPPKTYPYGALDEGKERGPFIAARPPLVKGNRRRRTLFNSRRKRDEKKRRTHQKGGEKKELTRAGFEASGRRRPS